jgi:diguanylate cyclase (GGDEF)-like protein
MPSELKLVGRTITYRDDETGKVRPLEDMEPKEIKAYAHHLMKEKLQLQRTVKKLERLVGIDKLTGLLNRYGIERDLPGMVARVVRENKYFSAIIFDVDRFKLFNDEHGHAAGDKVLVHIANVMRKTLRTGDVFGRWGGEEFVLFTYGDSPSEAEMAAERLRDAIANSSCQFRKKNLAVTASFGVSTFLPDQNLSTGSIVNLLYSLHLTIADKQGLLQAKRNGRNCVVGVTSQTKSKHHPAPQKPKKRDLNLFGIPVRRPT